MNNRLRASDVVVIVYLVLETVLILLGRERLAGWPWYLLAHLAMIAAVLLLARYATQSKWRLLHVVRDWYPALYIVLIFKQLGALIPAVHPKTYDDLLLAWDEAIFGGHPGIWFDGLASPLLTEVLRGCWLFYFPMPLLIALPLYLRKNRECFHETVLLLVLGWLVSYLGYYILPALGPGYFPEAIPAPECVNASGATQSVALTLFSLEGRMHDIFPSGHTIIALLALWLARRYQVRGWPLLIPVVAGLVMGTVYLRYHYGVDVLAGAAIAVLILGIRSLWR